MLQGRTLSYSDTQRHRVGANYLQLPINKPKVDVYTNQRDGAMTYTVDQGTNPHINYEPSSRGGLVETPMQCKPHAPYVEGKLVREPIERPNPYGQAEDRYRTFSQAEKEGLVGNLVSNLKKCNPDIQERMVGHVLHCDTEVWQPGR